MRQDSCRMARENGATYEFEIPDVSSEPVAPRDPFYAVKQV